MNKVHLGISACLGLALLFFSASWWRTHQEVRAITVANTDLRETLGRMTLAITEKDREIDGLSQSPCSGQEKPPAGGPAAWRSGE
jgi:hypothetical protein